MQRGPKKSVTQPHILMVLAGYLFLIIYTNVYEAIRMPPPALAGKYLLNIWAGSKKARDAGLFAQYIRYLLQIQEQCAVTAADIQ